MRTRSHPDFGTTGRNIDMGIEGSGFIDNGVEMYSIGPDGKRNYGTATNLKVNGELYYEFDPTTGTMHLSADNQSIAYLIQTANGLPAAKLVIPGPFGERLHAQNVREIKSVPRADGTFFLTIGSSQPKQAPSPQPVPQTKRRRWYNFF